MARCLLCTSNDPDGVIEHLAEKLWDSRQGTFEVATPWSEAGATWQYAFREMAVAARQALTIE
jgi:hypothetical protein